MAANLLEPYQLGDIAIANRMVVAPMTRNRADERGVVPDRMVTYYRQRASAGLVISESAPVSEQGVGYPFTPGIYTEEQVAGWRRVTQAVQADGGRIFIQLQHCGRISHPGLQPGGAVPVAPSALRPSGHAITYEGMKDFVTPRALDVSEIPDLVAQFQRAAEMAKRAGFDGVEVHGANGYIIDQFLRDGSNHRKDAYGGCVQNRMRLLNEILDAVSSVWRPSRVGVRLTPENSFNAMSDSNPQVHFEYIFEQLSARRLAYVHVLEGDMESASPSLNYRVMRDRFEGPYIANNGYDFARAEAVLDCGAADLVAFGVPFLANPDLVRRYRENLPLNTPDRSTFYGGGDAGYTDYPLYQDEMSKVA